MTAVIRTVSPVSGMKRVRAIRQSSWSTRDQPVALEKMANIVDRGVGRREDQVGVLERVSGERRAGAAYAVEQRCQRGAKAGLVAGLDGRLDRTVELVERLELVVGHLELTLSQDADDHPCCPFSSGVVPGWVSVSRTGE